MSKKVTKKKDLSETLKKKEQSQEIALTLPLNTEEQAMIDKWRRNEKESQVPLRFEVNITPQFTAYEMKSIADRGSDRDKQCLMNAALCEATGAKNYSFAQHLFLNCTSATGMIDRNKPNEVVKNTNAILDALYAMKPQDEIEGMLISKLISLHFQSMNYLGSSSGKDLSSQVRDMHINRSTKLSRLYNETLEALMRYRRKGMQQVVVQHVNVENGGQAIVGNVQTGGGIKDKT